MNNVMFNDMWMGLSKRMLEEVRHEMDVEKEAPPPGLELLTGGVFAPVLEVGCLLWSMALVLA